MRLHPPSTASHSGNGLQRPSTAVVKAILVRQFESVVGSCRDRLDRAKASIDQSRAALTSVGNELSALVARIDVVDTVLHSDIADGISQLESEHAVDIYLERVVDKLIRYGRSIRLVIYYIDPDTGLQYCPAKQNENSSTKTGICPFKNKNRTSKSFYV